MAVICRGMPRVLRQWCFIKGSKLCVIVTFVVSMLVVVNRFKVAYELQTPSVNPEELYLRDLSSVQQDPQHWLNTPTVQLTSRAPSMTPIPSELTYQMSPEASVRILTGIPRNRTNKLTIGIPTLKRPKGDYFLNTLASIFNESSEEDQGHMTVVVMLADRDPAYNQFRLQQLEDLYSTELQTGVLLAVSAPYTDYLFHTPHLKRTFNDSLDRVRWRSKQNLDYAALMEISANLSTYYLQIEDDVIAAPNFVRHIEAFVRKNSNISWAGLEFSNQGFIGKLFHNSDLHKLVTLLRTFYLEMPCDFIIDHFYRLMLQTKAIRRQGNLFFHQGKYSSLKDVVRKTENIPELTRKGSYGAHTNPKGRLFSSLTGYKKHVLAWAYDLTSSLFFWAADVKQGDHVTVVFDEPLKVEKIIVKTGFTVHGALHDYARYASVNLGRSVSNGSNMLARCEDTDHIGILTDGVFQKTVDSTINAACLSIVFTESQQEWLALTELVVFPKEAQ